MGKVLIVEGVFDCGLCCRVGGKYEASFIHKNKEGKILFEIELCEECASSTYDFMHTLKPERITEKELELRTLEIRENNGLL